MTEDAGTDSWLTRAGFVVALLVGVRPRRVDDYAEPEPEPEPAPDPEAEPEDRYP